MTRRILLLWHNLALSHIQKKDYSSAKEDLESLLTVAPRYTRAYLMRGEVFIAAERYDCCLD